MCTLYLNNLCDLYLNIKRTFLLSKIYFPFGNHEHMTHLLSRLWHKLNVKIVSAITHLDLPVPAAVCSDTQSQPQGGTHCPNHSLREEHTVLLLERPPSDVCAHRALSPCVVHLGRPRASSRGAPPPTTWRSTSPSPPTPTHPSSRPPWAASSGSQRTARSSGPSSPSRYVRDP